MLKEKRRGTKITLEPTYKLLNNVQLISLKNLAIKGWHVCFIRKPTFGLRIIVLHQVLTEKYGILNEDGTTDMSSELQVR